MPVILPTMDRLNSPEPGTEDRGSGVLEPIQVILDQPNLPWLPFLLGLGEWPQGVGWPPKFPSFTASCSVTLGMPSWTSVANLFPTLAHYPMAVTNTSYLGQIADDPSSEDVALEAAYQRIGWWKGPQAAREIRVEGQTFWADETRIRWLVARLRKERNIEILHGAASLLASLGGAIVPPILDELDGQSVGDNGLALLGALGKLPPAIGRCYQTRLWNSLRRYLKDNRSPELREAAALATALLPVDRATRLLQDSIQAETNPVVRETLEDALADRQDEKE